MSIDRHSPRLSHLRQLDGWVGDEVNVSSGHDAEQLRSDLPVLRDRDTAERLLRFDIPHVLDLRGKYNMSNINKKSRVGPAHRENGPQETRKGMCIICIGKRVSKTTPHRSACTLQRLHKN